LRYVRRVRGRAGVVVDENNTAAKHVSSLILCCATQFFKRSSNHRNIRRISSVNFSNLTMDIRRFGILNIQKTLRRPQLTFVYPF